MIYSRREAGLIEGLEVVRLRPAIDIGGANTKHSLCRRPVEHAVASTAKATPAPSAVRLSMGSLVTLTQGYRALFRRGGLVPFLGEDSLPEAAYGTSWITFAPDPDVVPGTGDVVQARLLVERVAAGAPGVDASFVDRSEQQDLW